MVIVITCLKREDNGHFDLIASVMDHEFRSRQTTLTREPAQGDYDNFARPMLNAPIEQLLCVRPADSKIFYYFSMPCDINLI